MSERAEQTTEEWVASLSADDCERIVENALAERDFPAVITAMKLLTSKDAIRANQVWETIKVGIRIACERQGAEVPDVFR